MILALDPGTTKTAWAVYAENQGVLMSYGEECNTKIHNVLLRHTGPGERRILGIERIASYGMPIGNETLQTCEWVGRYIELGLKLGMVPWPVYRKPVVAWLTGTARGNDAAVNRALKERYGTQLARVGSDIRSAVAVALFVAASLKAGKTPPNLLG